MMSWLNCMIGKNYALEMCILSFYKNWEDGIDFFQFSVIWDKYNTSHKPDFSIWISLLNITLLEFRIYNINHVDEEEDLDFE